MSTMNSSKAPPGSASTNQRSLNLPDTQNLRCVFDAFDHNRDGLLSIQELSNSMRKMGLPSNNDDLLHSLDSVDWDKDECLNFDEFVALNKILENDSRGATGENGNSSAGDIGSQKSGEESEMKEAFRVFDKDGNGQISPDELKTTLADLGMVEAGTTLTRIYGMIRKVDSDGDGQVNYAEFHHMMKPE